ncbi:slipin family protein [Chiayiivirga flava]|uniref:Regulator of protease activity HflC (Stomatin/prohibitin superfamily) n=1 Tax=Chiayiivirga flava TaxID=659595 RepID=A0A7W8G0F4_9GAMM|nr:slipin family protein [Chiayiivirga flava]MBB5209121.1 regulator of protease activity HflC (stomatin/prohibitin superfamily) [Chiayiivirga flava]
MFWTKRVVIGDGERGLVYRNKQFEAVLGPRVHRIVDPFNRVVVLTHSIANPEYAGRDIDTLRARLGDVRFDELFLLVDLRADEVGLVRQHGVIEDVLAPGTRKIFWRGDGRLSVERMVLDEGLQLRADVMQRLRQLGTLSKVAVAVHVPAESTGLVFIDGKLMRSLAPGAYAFWNFQKNVVAEVVEQRVQSIEVSGQELLTRDKVSLRVNLAASLRVVDPVAAKTRVAKFVDHVYRELQYGLRRAVAAKTLDELLGDKASLDADIYAYVHGRVGEFGIDMLGVGVKDVILPGEMKEILNGVVQAEKSAQANVIRRREEANATRSLLNTAKLIEESPVLMRLKELEALEKVTEKIDKLTVFGGLDGVLKQLVTMK